MFPGLRLTRIVLAISAVLSLSACAGNAQYLAPSPALTKGPAVTSSADDQDNANEPTLYPAPTPFEFPEKDILPPPTLTTIETFDCWTAPSSKTATRQDDRGQLLVAYRIDPSTWASNLYRFDFTTQKYSLLVSQIEAYAPSPDGLNIWYAFNTYKDGMQDVIFVHDLANNTRRQVPFPILIDSRYGHVVWSPDSQCLFAWRDDTAFAYRLKDGALQSKTFPGAKFGFNASAVSPDGRWWAWDCKTSWRPQDPNEQNFCLMTPQGRRIDHDGLHLPVAREPKSGFSTRSLGWWSPDSRVLAIAYPGTLSSFQDAARLIQVDEKGVSSFQDIASLGVLDDLLWSPDSRQLLIINNVARKLYIYNLATKETITVPTPDGNYLEAAAWSPDGKQIAIVTMDKQYKFGLYVMNADGTNASQIPPLPKEAEGAEMVTRNWLSRIFWVP